MKLRENERKVGERRTNKQIQILMGFKMRQYDHTGEVLVELFSNGLGHGEKKQFNSGLQDYCRKIGIEVAESYLTELSKGGVKNTNPQYDAVIYGYLNALKWDLREGKFEPPQENLLPSFSTLKDKYSIVYDTGQSLGSSDSEIIDIRHLTFGAPTKFKPFLSGRFERWTNDFDSSESVKVGGQLGIQTCHDTGERLLLLQFLEKQRIPPPVSFTLSRMSVDDFHVWHGIGLGYQGAQEDVVVAAKALMLPESVYKLRGKPTLRRDEVGDEFFNLLADYFSLGTPFDTNGCLRSMPTCRAENNRLQAARVRLRKLSRLRGHKWSNTDQSKT